MRIWSSFTIVILKILCVSYTVVLETLCWSYIRICFDCCVEIICTWLPQWIYMFWVARVDFLFALSNCSRSSFWSCSFRWLEARPSLAFCLPHLRAKTLLFTESARFLKILHLRKQISAARDCSCALLWTLHLPLTTQRLWTLMKVWLIVHHVVVVIQHRWSPRLRFERRVETLW